MIKDEVAFRQKYDMEAANTVSKFYTDIDMLQELTNGKWVWHEWKKDTLNHTPEEIIQTKQWKAIQRAAGTEDYAIYSTHNEEISDKDIPFENLTVRRVELNRQVLDFPAGISLQKYLNKIASVGMYYIKVKYAEGAEEIALVSPEEGEKWSTRDYWAEKCAFKTEEACTEYIKKRYEKEFNRSYIYSIYYVESTSSVKLVHRYTYPEMIGL